MKKIFPVILLAFIIAVIVFIEIDKQDTSIILKTGETITTGLVVTEEVTGNSVGDIAPNWRLQSFSGEIIELAELRGNPVMIDYFADWCPFCHKEFPFIEAAHQSYGDDVVFIGIHRTNTESEERGAFFATGEIGATFPLVKDTSGKVYGAYAIGLAMPISFFIDSNGVIRDKVIGPKTPERLDEAIQTILEH